MAERDRERIGTLRSFVGAKKDSRYEREGIKTNFLRRSFGTSLVNFGTSLGFRSICVRDGRET